MITKCENADYWHFGGLISKPWGRINHRMTWMSIASFKEAHAQSARLR